MSSFFSISGDLSKITMYCYESFITYYSILILIFFQILEADVNNVNKLNPLFKPILLNEGKKESNDPLEIKLFLITSLLFCIFNIVYCVLGFLIIKEFIVGLLIVI